MAAGGLLHQASRRAAVPMCTLAFLHQEHAEGQLLIKMPQETALARKTTTTSAEFLTEPFHFRFILQ